MHDTVSKTVETSDIHIPLKVIARDVLSCKSLSTSAASVSSKLKCRLPLPAQRQIPEDLVQFS